MPLKLRVATIVFALGAAAAAGAAGPTLDTKLLERGKTVFGRECAVCHGLSGKGDGAAAYLLFPPPRDFTSRMFKIRTTPEGEPPTRADLLRTLQRGLPGSAMPSYGSLPEGDLRALVEYVLSLAGLESTPQQTLAIPQVPPLTKEGITQGETVYNDLGCFECHGPKGDGRGTSATTMKDYKKRPIRPNDFTRGVFKGGSDPQSILTRFMTGMDGTPMPSFAEAANKEQLIALTQYVLSLSQGRDFQQPGTGTLPARRVRGNLPLRPSDPRWEKMNPTTVPMMHLHNDGRLPLEVAVRAAHDGNRLSIFLEWADATRDTEALSTMMFADGAAVQFPLREKNPPIFAMGNRGGRVNIWHWNAAAAAGPPEVLARYPGMAVDDYPLSGRVYPRREMGHPELPSARTTRPPFITAWAAGNPNSAPGRMRGIMDLNAEGFGTLQPQGVKGQNVTGSGRWRNGKWRVVFTRTLKSPEENDAQLLPGASQPIAFAVWDGSRRDRNGQKSVTTWYRLSIE